MKTLIITLLTAVSIMITANLSYSQVGIGTKTPDANSVLDVNANTSTTTLTVDKDGRTRIGNVTAGNTTYIEEDGSLSYEDTATRYDDMRVPVTSAKFKDNDIDRPNFDIFISGLAGYWFQEDRDNEPSLFFNVQMPHAWKEGTAIYPHIHWVPERDLSGKTVVWGFEYAWVNVGDEFPTTSTTIYASAPIAPGGTPLAGTAGQHMITPFASIDGTDMSLSSMLVCRMFRVDKNYSADNYTYMAMVLEFDFHYQIDSDGSRDEYTK